MLFIPQKIKSSSYYPRSITPKRVTSGRTHLRDLAPGPHSPEETLQQWQAVGDTVYDLAGPALRIPDLSHRQRCH